MGSRRSGGGATSSATAWTRPRSSRPRPRTPPTIWRRPPERYRLDERRFVHVPSVLAPHAVARVRADLDAHARQHVTPSAYGVICHNPWRHVAAARDIIERTLAPLALELLGADELALFQDFLISKPPGASAAVKW